MKLFAFFFLLLFTSTSHEWVLAKQKNGISIYTKQADHKKLKEFRAETVLNCSIDKMEAILKDLNSMNQWYDMIEKIEVLKTISNTEAIYKIYFDFPIVTSDRYSVLHASIVKNADNSLTATTKFDAMIHHPEKNRVFIKDIRSSWIVSPIDNHKVKVEHSGFMDPAGSIPQWLINQNIVDSPMKTLSNLKKIAEKK